MIYSAQRSPWRNALLLLAACGFVVAGAWIAGLIGTAPADAPVLAGWLAMLFFGAAIPIILKRLFDRGDILRIGPDGVWVRDHADVTIPWDEIAGYHVWQYERQRVIILRLHRPERYPGNRVASALAGASREMMGGEVAISLTGSTGKVDDALEAIGRCLPY